MWLSWESTSICKLLGLIPAAHKIGMVAYDINTLTSKYSFKVLSFHKLLGPRVKNDSKERKSQLFH